MHKDPGITNMDGIRALTGCGASFALVPLWDLKERL